MRPYCGWRGSLRASTIAAMEWLGSGRITSAGLARLGADPRQADQVYRDLKAQKDGFLTAVFVLNLDAADFVARIINTVQPADFLTGLPKTTHCA